VLICTDIQRKYAVKANWIDHNKNCLLKDVIVTKIQGSLEVTRRRRRRRKPLLDNLKEKTGCWKLKEETLDRIRGRTGFGGDMDVS